MNLNFMSPAQLLPFLVQRSNDEIPAINSSEVTTVRGSDEHNQTKSFSDTQVGLMVLTNYTNHQNGTLSPLPELVTDV